MFESIMLAKKTCIPEFHGKVTLKYDPSRVKKDVLYKPLLRIFRNAIKEFVGDMGEGAWNLNQMKDNVWLVMENIDMPKDLMTEKSLHSLMYLIFSKVHNSKGFCEGEFRELAKYQDEITLTFNSIFKQNTVAER